MGGLQRGKMYVIAGRPGVGKSAFSNQMIFDILDTSKDRNVIVLYWSFEMPGISRYFVQAQRIPRCRQFELCLLNVDSQ